MNNQGLMILAGGALLLGVAAYAVSSPAEDNGGGSGGGGDTTPQASQTKWQKFLGKLTGGFAVVKVLLESITNKLNPAHKDALMYLIDKKLAGKTYTRDDRELWEALKKSQPLLSPLNFVLNIQ